MAWKICVFSSLVLEQWQINVKCSYAIANSLSVCLLCFCIKFSRLLSIPSPYDFLLFLSHLYTNHNVSFSFLYIQFFCLFVYLLFFIFFFFICKQTHQRARALLFLSNLYFCTVILLWVLTRRNFCTCPHCNNPIDAILLFFSFVVFFSLFWIVAIPFPLSNYLVFFVVVV